MSTDIDYSQQRSLNLGIAMDVGSLGAAAIYDDLVYAQKVFGEGFFYRSYDQMMKRFPMWSERTIRNYVRKLENNGWLETTVKKVDGMPLIHYKVCRFLSAKFADSMVSAKIADSINIETKKKLNTDSISSGGEKTTDLGPASTARARALMPKLLEIINPKEKVTADRLRVLNGRLKDYTEDEIIESAKALSRSHWHKKNGQMSVDNLIAPSKFGRWYAQRNHVAPAPVEDDDTDTPVLTHKEAAERLRKMKELGKRYADN
jgi:hypothetical protein